MAERILMNEFKNLSKESWLNLEVMFGSDSLNGFYR
jgi:hypothetical protein